MYGRIKNTQYSHKTLQEQVFRLGYDCEYVFVHGLEKLLVIISILVVFMCKLNNLRHFHLFLCMQLN